MQDQTKLAPRWLLIEVGLTDGIFEDGGTTVVVGRPDAHNSAVLNVGNGPPKSTRVDLTKRNDWDTLKKRLTDEGF
jgi:hypothetical protein